MYFSIPLVVLAAAAVNCLSNAPAKHPYEKLSTPLVPLCNKYGKGPIPPPLQSCGAGALGHTFMNGIYDGKATALAPLGFTSCFPCLYSVAQELPCIYEFVKSHNPLDLLKCGITKTQVCTCLTCLPSVIQPIIKPFCDSAASGPVTTQLLDAGFVASDDLAIKAFLGLLTLGDIPDLLNGTTTLGGALGGSLGGSCGCSNTCIGFCIQGNCQGICA